MKLINEEKIDKMLRIIKELSQSSNAEDNIQAVVLSWCLEDLEILDKPKNKAAPPAAKLNGTTNKITQVYYTDKQEETSMPETIAEIMINKWVDFNFCPRSVKVDFVEQRKARVTDRNGDSITVEFYPETGEVKANYEPKEL